MYSSNGSNRIPQDRIAAPSGKHRTVSASLPGACSAFRSAADIPDSDLAPVQIVRITRAGTPPTIARSRTFLVTTAPAVTTTLSPMVTPERIVAFDPIQTFFFKTIDADSRSSKHGISAVSRKFRASTCCKNSFCAIVVPHISKLFRDDIPCHTVKPRYPGERTHPFP